MFVFYRYRELACSLLDCGSMNLKTDNVTRQLTVPDILASATAAHDFTNISCDFTVETLFANGCVYL